MADRNERKIARNTGQRRGRARGDADARVNELFERTQGVFMISIAAELAGMHPQTLRMYEARGLIKPSRSPKKTRLYSEEDVQRLRRIQELTTELGLNLAGVERVLAMEQRMESMRARLDRLEREAAEMERQMLAEIELVHRSYRRELVRWEPPGQALRWKRATRWRSSDGGVDATG
jgi:MerR family transcriptional regulator/heat shock protein HspR